MICLIFIVAVILIGNILYLKKYKDEHYAPVKEI